MVWDCLYSLVCWPELKLKVAIIATINFQSRRSFVNTWWLILLGTGSKRFHTIVGQITFVNNQAKEFIAAELTLS